MSNESFTDAATSAHAAEKLKAPKSLHGIEDVEVIWDTITRRFPNAAPLLCEMETVIERAEDLLQQLKTPSNHDNGTRSSPLSPSRAPRRSLLSREDRRSRDRLDPRHVAGLSGLFPDILMKAV